MHCPWAQEPVVAMAVLSGGNIVEQGSHSQLIGRTNGAYSTLLKLQVSAQRQQEEAPKFKEAAGSPAAADAAEDEVIVVEEVQTTSSSC